MIINYIWIPEEGLHFSFSPLDFNIAWNDSLLSCISRTVRSTCPGINGVGWNLPMNKMTVVETASQLPWKVIENRDQVTHFWMFVISPELTRHSHLSSLFFDAVLFLLAILNIVKSHSTVFLKKACIAVKVSEQPITLLCFCEMSFYHLML